MVVLTRRMKPTAWACWLAGLLGLVALALPPLLGLTYIGFDLTLLSLPFHHEVREALSRGEGLWLSPRMGNGSPLWTRPEAQVLYPLRWLTLPLPSDLAVSVEVALHGMAGAASCTFLARTLGVRPLAAAMAGLSYVLTGTFLNLVVHGHYITGWAWVPLAWGAGRGVLAGVGGRTPRVLLAAALLLILAGPEPQAFAVAAALLAAECAGRLVRRPRSSWPAVARVVVAGAGAFLASLVVWLPTLSEMALSPRGGSLAAGDVLTLSLTPDLWPAILWPGVFSQFTSDSEGLYAAFHGADTGVWNPTPYLGLALVAVLPLGVLHRRAWWPLGVTLGSFVLAVGSTTPLLPWLAELFPPVAMFRFPAKYFVLTSLAAVVTGFMVLDRSTRRGGLRRVRWAWAVAALGGALGLGWAATWTGSLNNRQGEESVEGILLRAALGGFLPLVAGLALTWVRRGAWLPVIIVADLVVAAPTALFVGRGLVDLPGPVSLLGEPGRRVVCHDRDMLVRRMTTGGACTSWEEVVSWRKLGLPELQACAGLVFPIPYSPTYTRMQVWMLDGLRASPGQFTRALGCEVYVTTTPPGPGEGLEPLDWRALHARAANPPPLEELFSGLERNPARAYVLRDPIPEALFVTQAEPVASEGALAAYLAAGRDPTRVVDDPTGMVRVVPTGGQVTGVRLERLRPHHLRVELDGLGGGLTVVRTTFWLGWRAFQGGREVPVVRVGGMFVGALVEDAGGGPVEFRYRSPGVGLGMGCLVVGMLALAWVVLVPVRRRGKRAGPCAPPPARRTVGA
jgi:hypothetical protein